jgi:hypothetical protein
MTIPNQNLNDLILLDSGATANLVYSSIFNNLPPFIKLLEKKKLKNILKVKAAFGDFVTCTELAMLDITIPDDFHIISSFIILPHGDSQQQLVFGKPLLHQLHYRLDDFHQYITIDNIEIPLNHHAVSFRSHTIVKSLFQSTGYYKEKFPSVFDDKISAFPTHEFKYQVILQNFDYFTARPFYANSIQSKEIKNFIEEGLRDGVLQEIKDTSTLIALAPVFPIHQKANKTRVVTDFRSINKALIFQPDSIPPVDLLIQNLFPYKIYSTLDLKSAYYNVPFDLTGSKIGITTIRGNFQFKKLPFGLASAPAVFTRFMRYILKELHFDPSTDFVQCYLDDIIVASTNTRTHKAILDKVFQLLEKYSLRLTEKKVKLFQESIEFLGYKIQDSKRTIADSKITAIQNWEFPQNTKEWYKFIGFINYLSSFIPNCPSLLKPLYTHYHFANKKENKNLGSPVSNTILQNNFNQLKSAVCQTLNLQLFDPNKTVFILTDASDLGVGAILLQEYKNDPKQLVPIAFYSKSFTSTQHRYSALERELLGILLALNHNYLLLSDHIIVLTEHQALVSYSNKSSMLNTRMLKFVEILSTYPLTIKYIPGKKNIADFLSRFHVTKQPVLSTLDFQALSVEDSNHVDSTLSVTLIPQDHFPKLTHLTDDDTQAIYSYLKDQTEVSSSLQSYLDTFLLYEDKLSLIVDSVVFEVMSFPECQDFMQSQHNKFHGSPIVLLDLLQAQGLVLPQAQLIATDIVKNCSNCDLFTRFSHLPAPYQQVKTPELGDVWHIDFIGPLISVQAAPYLHMDVVRYMIVAVEYTTGFCVALPYTTMSDTVVIKFITQLLLFYPLTSVFFQIMPNHLSLVALNLS